MQVVQQIGELCLMKILVMLPFENESIFKLLNDLCLFDRINF